MSVQNVKYFTEGGISVHQIITELLPLEGSFFLSPYTARPSFEYYWQYRGHPVNVPIRRTMHLSSVIPANDTRESLFGNFPRRKWGSNLGPKAPEASA